MLNIILAQTKLYSKVSYLLFMLLCTCSFIVQAAKQDIQKDSTDPSSISESLESPKNLNEELFPEHDTPLVVTEDNAVTMPEESNKEKQEEVEKNRELQKEVEQEEQTKKANDENSRKRLIVAGFIIYGNEIISNEEVLELCNQYLEKPVNNYDIYNIGSIIRAAYAQAGYSTTIVETAPGIPENTQIVDGLPVGIIKIRVYEVYYTELDFHKYKNDALNVYANNIVSSIPLNDDYMTHQLLLMNRLPGVDAGAVNSAASEEYMKLNIHADLKRNGGYIGFDNMASLNIGPAQVKAGAYLNNLFAANKISVGFATTPAGIERMQNLSFSYKHVFPRTSGTELEFNIEASKTKPHRDELALIELKTNTIKYNANIIQPMILTRENTTLAKLDFDAAHIKSTNITGLQYEDKIRSITLGVNSRLKDRFHGINLIEASATKAFEIAGASNGDITTSRTDNEDKSLKSNFFKLNFSYTREAQLINNFSYQLAANTQISPNSLFSSEQISYGGLMFGPAYYNSSLMGDSGAMAKAELRYTKFMQSNLIEYVQPYATYDFGFVRNHKEDSLEVSNAQSFSAGLRINTTNDLSANFIIAKPFTKAATEDNDTRFRFLLSITKSF